MTASVGSSFAIALVIVVCLGLCIGIVMWAAHRPSFKHRSRPPKTETGLSGGIHQGDPRSVSPHRDEPVVPDDQAGQPRRQR